MQTEGLQRPRLYLIPWPAKSEIDAGEKTWGVHFEQCKTLFETHLFPLFPSYAEACAEWTRVTAADPAAYEPFETHAHLFYWHLMCKIADDLRGHVYTEEELQEKVPHIDSPFYSRETVMIKYMEGMMVMKPRGEEWETRLAVLKSMVEN